jgi:hypothetical protein
LEEKYDIGLLLELLLSSNPGVRSAWAGTRAASACVSIGTLSNSRDFPRCRASSWVAAAYLSGCGGQKPCRTRGFVERTCWGSVRGNVFLAAAFRDNQIKKYRDRIPGPS